MQVRIGDVLKQAGLITEEQILDVQTRHLGEKKRLGELLIEDKIVGEKELATALAKHLDLPFVQLGEEVPEPDALSLFPEPLARRHLLIPVRRRGGQLTVAMADPLDLIAVEDIRMRSEYEIVLRVGLKSEILNAIDLHYGQLALGEEGAPPPQVSIESAIYSYPPEAQKAQTYVFISSRPGVGTSHVISNLAICLGRISSTLLIDADLREAPIAPRLGLFPGSTFLDFATEEEIGAVTVDSRLGFDLIPGDLLESSLPRLSESHKHRFLLNLKKVHQSYSHILIDVGAGKDPLLMEIGIGADHTVLVTTPDSVVGTYALIRTGFEAFVAMESNIRQIAPDLKPRTVYSPLVIFNQVGPDDDAQQDFAKIQKALTVRTKDVGEGYRVEPILAGAVPDDRDYMAEAERSHRAYLDLYPRRDASQAFEALAQRLVEIADQNFRGQEDVNRFQRLCDAVLRTHVPSAGTAA